MLKRTESFSETITTAAKGVPRIIELLPQPRRVGVGQMRAPKVVVERTECEPPRSN